MSLIQAMGISQYTTIANNAAYSWMSANNARMSMISSISNNPSSYSLESLAELDTQLELQALTSSLQYKMAKAMLEQLKKQQKEDAKKFSIFA